MSDSAWSDIANAIAVIGVVWALAWCTAQPDVHINPSYYNVKP